MPPVIRSETVTDLPVSEITIDRDETAPTGKPVSPVPPRFWWLKRIIVVSATLLVVLLGVRLWWGWEANRRLQAEIDRIIAAGEPIYPADFDPPEMLPEENAAKLYLDAEAALNLTPTQNEFVNRLAGDYAEIRQRMDDIEPIVLANAKAYQLVRQGSELKKFDWGNRRRSPAINFMVPNLSMHRYLSKVLSVTATYHAERGNYAEALATLLDAFRFADAIDREPYLISHLVALACQSLFVGDVEHLAPTLAVGRVSLERDAGSTTGPHRLVSALISELLDERSFRAALIRAMQADRMIVLDLVQMLVRGNAGIGSLATWGPIPQPRWWERSLVFPVTPLLELDALVGIRFYSAFVEGAGKPNWPSARAAFPPEPADSSPLERLTRPVSGFILSSVDRVVFQHFRALAESRMAAIALAIRLYEVDHGRRPEALVELVPEYLPAVPADPLAANGRPIGYLPHAPKPLLYSVGKNGTDDEGGYELRSNGTIDRAALDQPFFLNGDRPTRQREADERDIGSGERDDDRDDVDGDDGNAEQNESGQR